MRSRLILGLSVLGVSIFSIQADTLRLRDGRVLTGTFQGANRDEIRFQRDGGPMDRYDVGSVDSITFGNDRSNANYNDRRDSSRYNDRDRSADQYGNRAGTADRYRERDYNDRAAAGTAIPAGTVVSVRMID